MSMQYWNNMYRSIEKINPTDSIWLNQYIGLFSETKEKPIIDLGCGSGSDSIYLLNNGYSVISCDFSKEILDKLVDFDSRINPRHFDIQNGLPFKDSRTYIVLASLSLHYFTWEKTEKIVSEIKRVLEPGGYVICRLNSVNDINYGAGKGIKIEENFYEIEGYYKRFFDKPTIEKLFSCWEITVLKESNISRYEKAKKAWEVVVKKP